jgi:hypothetical protein
VPTNGDIPTVSPSNKLCSVSARRTVEIINSFWGAHGSVVVKAVCYKPEGCGFETR